MTRNPSNSRLTSLKYCYKITFRATCKAAQATNLAQQITTVVGAPLSWRAANKLAGLGEESDWRMGDACYKRDSTLFWPCGFFLTTAPGSLTHNRRNYVCIRHFLPRNTNVFYAPTSSTPNRRNCHFLFRNTNVCYAPTSSTQNRRNCRFMFCNTKRLLPLHSLPKIGGTILSFFVSQHKRLRRTYIITQNRRNCQLLFRNAKRLLRTYIIGPKSA